MQLKEIKPYTTFIIISLLFVITISAGIIFYNKCVSKLNDKKVEDEISLEITLPVIEWGKYESLSKKYLNGSIKQK